MQIQRSKLRSIISPLTCKMEKQNGYIKRFFVVENSDSWNKIDHSSIHVNERKMLASNVFPSFFINFLELIQDTTNDDT